MRFLVLLCMFSFSAQAATDCMKAILNDDINNIMPSCVELGGEDFQQKWYQGRLTHEFGTKEQPSKAAIIIKGKAEAGQADYQYLWGLISQFIYRQFSVAHIGSQIDKKWIIAAADNGQVAAMAQEIQAFMGTISMPKRERQQQVLDYAVELHEQYNNTDTELLIAAVKSRETIEDVIERMRFLYDNYTQLSSEQLNSLWRFYLYGHYESAEKVVLFDKEFSVSGRFDPDLAKGMRILKYNFSHFKSISATMTLANIYSRSYITEQTEWNKQKALNYYKVAKDLNHPRAVTWYGDYLHCIGQKTEGIALLRQAASLNDEDAKESLEDIKQLGYTVNCSQGWIY
ncbi:hypothetical protein [uncultured Shewanella sp.]|uniref:hypothetical protein n=1 Tax=uncultured Shewanella sp. TaxID=173975 RepID=UPI00262BC8F2|nr:hypothetical protein [uncultured Shewanella sp.]